MRLSNVKKKEIFMPAPSEAFTIAMLYKEKSEGGVPSCSTTIIFRCVAHFRVR